MQLIGIHRDWNSPSAAQPTESSYFKQGTQPGVNGGSPRTTNYDHDDQGQLTEDGSTSHSYDANGNRDCYTCDWIHANQIEDGGIWSYSYDGEGNVADKISTSLDLHWHYVYDHANQLAEAKQYDYDASGPEVLLLEVDYVYDVYGNRIEKIVDADGQGSGTAVATKFAVDGWNNTKSTPIGNENWDVWADLDGSSSLTTRYLRGDAVDQLFGRIGSGDPYWHLADHLGSVRDVITTSGVESIDYDAFGNVLADDAARGRYGWTGRELDLETGLQYNRARYYDSATGRWVGQDPMGFDAGDSNLYRYVKNEYLSSIDPNGMWTWQINRTGKIIATSEHLDTLEDLVMQGYPREDIVKLAKVQLRTSDLQMRRTTNGILDLTRKNYRTC